MASELAQLWQTVDDCSDCRQAGNGLRHIMGGGLEKEPDIMFVFINPTHRNITSRADYDGPRFPFLGTNEIWKVFADAGLLEPDLVRRVGNGWNQELIEKVICTVREAGLYFTNLVKCTQPDSRMPSRKMIRKKLDLLLKEISIVHPKLIVAFGILPFETLSNAELKLATHYQNQISSTDLLTYPSIPVLDEVFQVFPCYFPVGRGDRKRAIDLLKVLEKAIWNHATALSGK
jgi:uracil-DNA glycosylase family 4